MTTVVGIMIRITIRIIEAMTASTDMDMSLREVTFRIIVTKGNQTTSNIGVEIMVARKCSARVLMFAASFRIALAPKVTSRETKPRTNSAGRDLKGQINRLHTT